MVESAELERVGSISSRLKGTPSLLPSHKTTEGGLVQSHPQVLSHFRCAETGQKWLSSKTSYEPAHMGILSAHARDEWNI